MTVKQLIRELKKMPGELPVITDGFDGDIDMVRQSVRVRTDGWGGPGLVYRSEPCVIIGKDLLKGAVP